MKTMLFALGVGLSVLALRALRRAKAPSLLRPSPVAPPPSYDEIALRAYFIGLEREARGEPSAPLHDWKEAELQLSSPS